MRTARRFAAAVFVTALAGLSLGAAVVRAATPYVDGELANPALQARYEHITHRLRCLVCQNETVADSDAELAAELRSEVRQMLLAGKTNAQIYRFMKDRYGEFVLYDPPVDAKTVFIWGAPFAFLLIGGIVVYRIVRVRSKMPLDEEPETGPTP